MGAVLALSVLAVVGSGAPSAGAEATCPNEAIRQAQQATQLGACRAWEMVSPVDKNGGEVLGNGVNTFASTSGEGFAFDSQAVFGDAVGSGGTGVTTYLARRTPGGWATHAITPASLPQAVQVLPARTQTEIFSDDLSHALTTGYDLPGASDDTPGRINYYLEDTATRGLRTISRSQRGNGEDPFQYRMGVLLPGKEFWGASADLKHVAWVTSAQMLPAGAAPGYPQEEEGELKRNVYTWDDGVLHLAGILPDGNVPPGGSRVEPEGQEGIRGTLSSDGARQSFIASPTAGGQPQLYLRIDGNRTVWVSEPENEEFAGEPETVFFEGMTADGRTVFFSSMSPLLKADTASGPDLYRWTDGPDPEHEQNLTLITNDGSVNPAKASFGGVLVGMSDDASRVFVGGNGIRLWEAGSGLRLIAPGVSNPGEPKERLFLVSTDPGGARVSPDGNWLAYVVEGNISLYDRVHDELICITCSSVAADVSLFPQLTESIRYDNVGARPRFLSNDGQVFFSTKAPLVPQDVNGVYDAYEYDGPTGDLRLLSSGRGEEPAMFAEASPNGDDVFFATRQALIASDTDNGALDFYDARVGGGFPEEPSPAACVGEACQGAASAVLAAPAISSTVAGRGNVARHRHRRCAKGRHAVRRHGKVRCVKRHRGRRDAGADRGGRR